MTKPITEILATLPSGAQGSELDMSQLGEYLAKYCNTDELTERAKRHALREELYRDGGCAEMNTWLDKLFKDPDVRELRKQFVKRARFNNVTRRIAHSLATVYTEPAKRVIEGDDNAVKYQALLDAVEMDEKALEISRLLCLHRVLLVGFRVRETPEGEREPVLDIVSPANARPVLHPNDTGMIVGWLIRSDYRPAGATTPPAWTLWTAHESVQLTDEMRPLDETYQAHGFGVCPWVPVSFEASWGVIGHEGEDITSAHLTVWFENVLLAKESKSATTTSVLNGDGSRTARGQALDSQSVVEVGDGQSLSTIDTSMDLTMFTDTADHVCRAVAMNHGLPPAVLEHQGTQSAEARELLMMPLKELRRQMQLPLRRFEMRLARVMAAVCRVDAPNYAFDSAAWRMEFADVSTPLDPVSQFQLFEKYRAAGLKNSIEFLMELRPGLTFDQAARIIQENFAVELWRNLAMRSLQAVSGSAGATLPTDDDDVTAGSDTAANDSAVA